MACYKSDVPETDTLQVFLTDGPVDFQKVEIKVDKDSGHKHDDYFAENEHDHDDHMKNKVEYRE